VLEEARDLNRGIYHEDQEGQEKKCAQPKINARPAGAGAPTIYKNLPSNALPSQHRSKRSDFEEWEEFPPNCCLWLSLCVKVVPLNPVDYREFGTDSRVTISPWNWRNVCRIGYAIV